MEFETGKLYQVYYNKNWIIAEYVKTIEAHSYKYHNMNMNTMRISDKEYTRDVPTCHQWKTVYGGYQRSTVAKTTQTRPVTEETLAEIKRLKDALAQNERDREALRAELKVLTL